MIVDEYDKIFHKLISVYVYKFYIDEANLAYPDLLARFALDLVYLATVDGANGYTVN